MPAQSSVSAWMALQEMISSTYVVLLLLLGLFFLSIFTLSGFWRQHVFVINEVINDTLEYFVVLKNSTALIL